MYQVGSKESVSQRTSVFKLPKKEELVKEPERVHPVRGVKTRITHWSQG